jgi:hypothetical protein
MPGGHGSKPQLASRLTGSARYRNERLAGTRRTRDLLPLLPLDLTGFAGPRAGLPERWASIPPSLKPVNPQRVMA